MRSLVSSGKRRGFERLENRTVLNGTVFVTGALGALTMQGDARSNYLLIRQVGTTPGGGVNIRVQGLATKLDNVDTGTSGSAFTFTGITNIAIDLSQGGNDQLTLINTNIAGQRDIAIGFGGGNDVLTMFPISRKQALGAQKMQELKPEMDRINEKYKGKPEDKTRAMQELWRKHNYNPMSGCLLAFLQLPIFFGLWRALMINVELRGAPLFGEAIHWCSNLAAPDMRIIT